MSSPSRSAFCVEYNVGIVEPRHVEVLLLRFRQTTEITLQRVRNAETRQDMHKAMDRWLKMQIELPFTLSVQDGLNVMAEESGLFTDLMYRVALYG